MSEKSYEEKLAEARELYFTIGSIPCPALNNEKVYFEWNGFRHLVRKGRVPRKMEDQLRRFKLLPYAVQTIKEGEKISDTRDNQFMALGLVIGDKRIKIILRKADNGKLYFVSIMS
jgi:hypothetical protein